MSAKTWLMSAGLALMISGLPAAGTPYFGSPAAIPGTIQAEHFDLGGEGVAYHDAQAGQIQGGGAITRTAEDVELELSGDTGGGYHIGFTDADDWLEYTVNVPSSGVYQLEIRTALGTTPNGTLHFNVDSVPLTNSNFTIIDTGGWGSWSTSGPRFVTLTAGVHVLRMYFDTAAVGNINWFRFSVPPPPSTPYFGTPLAVPGTVEVEHFDLGGEGLAYHDAVAGNGPGVTRTTEDVDLENTSDGSGVYNIGFSDSGDWLKYTVNVSSSGVYQLELRRSNGTASTGFVNFEVDGAPLGAAIATDPTGGWGTWVTSSPQLVTLTAGTHVIRMVFTSGTIGNVNWFRFSAPPPPSTPYFGTPLPIPGLIEAEHFDLGGEGIAYHDAGPGNGPGVTRTTEDVDIENTSDISGIFNLGFTDAGDWLKYTVNVAADGVYQLELRTALGTTPDGTLHFEVDGGTLAGSGFTIMDTGGWGAWSTSTRFVTLTAGVHVLRMVFDSNAIGNINWIRVTTAPTPAAPYFGTALPIPGTLEAEHFDLGGEGQGYHELTPSNAPNVTRTSESVDLEATGDLGGGWHLGFTDAGEWTQYSVNVSTSGVYQLELRTALGTTPVGSLHLEIDGLPLNNTNYAMTDTGGWSNWQTTAPRFVTLTAGLHTLKLVLDTDIVGNINWIRFTSTAAPTPTPSATPVQTATPSGTPSQTPFQTPTITLTVQPSTPWLGVPRDIPGTIEAEHFDLGGEGVAYHDAQLGQIQGGGAITRTAEDVEIEQSEGGAGTYHIGFTDTGDWLNYTVNVASSGVYQFELRRANGTSTAGDLHFDLDGSPLSGTSVNTAGTGGWGNWVTSSAQFVTLTAGVHVLRMNFDASIIGNINWFRFVIPTGPTPTFTVSPTPGLSSPFGGSPRPIPGQIEVEDFDAGGEGVAYHDSSAGQQPGANAARTGDSVDIEACGDTGGGFNLGFTDSSEWLKYTVSIAASGAYQFELRRSNGDGAPGALHFELDGVPLAGTNVTTSPTGGWGNWTTTPMQWVTLTAGVHVIRMAYDSGTIGNMNWFSFKLPPTPTPQPVIPPAVNSVVPVPNPQSGPKINIVVDLAVGADKVQLRLYSPGYTQLGSTLVYNLGAGRSLVQLDGEALPNGTYYVKVDAWKGEDHVAAPPAKIYLLK